ncbi:MAG: Eco57I restriction-modification methylase domain-containing protein [Promethearchaeota archaeon]
MKSSIEEFMLLYRNAWRYLFQNVSGFDDKANKEQFVSSLLLQMLILWFIQRKRFFNDDSNYLITKFNEITTNQSPFRNYFKFIIYFSKKILLHTDNGHFDSRIIGKIVIPGPVIIFNLMKDVKGISIPNKCFYNEEFSSNDSSLKRNSDNFPVLNFFDSHVGKFNGFILSDIYEGFITQMEKKVFGTYYTPEVITSYITKSTINSYLLDKVNAKFKSNFENLSSIIDSHNIKIIIYLIIQLQTIKLLDPAVGTGHLLESALKGLLDIYRRIWREIDKKTLIKEGGNLNNFLEISDIKDFTYTTILYIVSNNLYGIDTNPTVLKIATVRLLLLLIEFFNSHSLDFPVVNFNLKEGNSLLGYISSTQPLNLDSYLSKTSNSSESIENLDQRFSQKYSIPLPELKKMKTFHWAVEFPEIMQRGGFGIIIANPPYLGESGSKELFRVYAKGLVKYYEGKMDLWYLFLQRSLDLMQPNAFSSFITSNYWVAASGATKLRARIFSDTYIVQYINFGENKVFNTAQGVHINLITFKKSRKGNDNIKCILFDTTYPLGTNLIHKLKDESSFHIKQENLIFEKWDDYFHFFSERIRGIIEQIIENSTFLKNSGFYVKEGIVTGLNNITKRQIKKYGLPEEWVGLGVFILDKNNPQDVKIIESFSQEEKHHLKNFYKNSDISKYISSIHTKRSILYLNRNTMNLELLPKIKTHIQKFQEILYESLDNPPYLNRPRQQDIFVSPKIVTPQRSLRNNFAYNSFDWYAAQDVYYILNDKNNRKQLKSLLLILNSKLAYFWFYWMGKRKGNQLELFGEPIGNFPFPKKSGNFLALFTKLSEYLLFLYLNKHKKEQFQDLITNYESEIVDPLVYELYLNDFSQKNTFHYPLLENLSQFIECIEFDKWEELYYKKYLGGGLSNDEKHHLEILETDHVTMIERNLNLILGNKQISNLVKQIKAWNSVKTIEEVY